MYSKVINRESRTLFMLVIDSSLAMAEPIWSNEQRASKSQVVSDITNHMIFELVERARRGGEVRDYYDIAIITHYNGAAKSVFGDRNYLSVSEIEASNPPTLTTNKYYTLPSGWVSSRIQSLPQWVRINPEGKAAQVEALKLADEIVKDWCAKNENQNSFPPMIYNITGGTIHRRDHSTMLEVCTSLKTATTNDGRAILHHIEISDDQQPTMIFPSVAALSQQHSLLMECSSIMPAVFEEAICEINHKGEEAPFLAISHNASLHELIAILNIGSASLTLQ